MELLPTEIIINILTRDCVEVQDVFNFASTCSRFHNLIKYNDAIWKSKYIQMYLKMMMTRKCLIGNFTSIFNPSKHSVFYDELLYIRSLHLRTRALLEQMSVVCHHKIQFRPSDFTEWDQMLKEKPDDVYYYVADYLIGIVNSKAIINTPGTVPFNTPGNLTRKHYALKVLRHIHRKYLTEVFKLLSAKSKKYKLVEEGAVFVAQWCQPNKLIEPETIHDQLDELTELVKCRLRSGNPNHPLFQTSSENFTLWKREVTNSHEWKGKDSLWILEMINKVLFSFQQFKVTACRQDPLDLNDMYIDQVLNLKRGSPELVGIIYQAIARRLGLYLEPIIEIRRFVLGYTEHPFGVGSISLNINVTHKGQFTHKGLNVEVCRGQPLYTYLTYDQLLSRISDQVGAMFDAMYEESDDNSACLGFLELKVLVNAGNCRDLMRLVSIYLQYGFDNEAFEDVLKNNRTVRELIESKDSNKPDVPPVLYQSFRDKEMKHQAIQYAVGMVVRHKVHGYRAVIFNWDGECVATSWWQKQNGINKLIFKDKQPFYNLLVEDGTHRYVGQENIGLEYAPEGLKVPEEKLGKFFTHFYETYYVPNKQVEYEFPGDAAVRRYHQNVVCLNLSQI